MVGACLPLRHRLVAVGIDLLISCGRPHRLAGVAPPTPPNSYDYSMRIWLVVALGLAGVLPPPEARRLARRCSRSFGERIGAPGCGAPSARSIACLPTPSRPPTSPVVRSGCCHEPISKRNASL